ncbi:hypothetical protein [Nocardioides sp. B-3]|uniref:hypothetical protein n=1 Tax=Nocardioides sp. B-3 TaxID=2895565 RepID=UPI0021524479|nr:hypothetical protein [Nocardioides sp. B-3]UUZ59440.1 hypothetical protein LP418_27230 [Nocardioides sp. B-3]
MTLGGVFTHGGHSYAGRDRVAAASNDEVTAIERAVEVLVAAGFAVPIRSVGSTPTAIESAKGPGQRDPARDVRLQRPAAAPARLVRAD